MVDESLVADFLSNNESMDAPSEDTMIDTLYLLKDRGIYVSASQTRDNSPETSNMSPHDDEPTNQPKNISFANLDKEINKVQPVVEKATTEICLEPIASDSDNDS